MYPKPYSIYLRGTLDPKYQFEGSIQAFPLYSPNNEAIMGSVVPCVPTFRVFRGSLLGIHVFSKP